MSWMCRICAYDNDDSQMFCTCGAVRFDLANGKAARDEGIKQVSEHAPEFMVSAMHLIEQIPFGWEGIGEDIAAFLLSRGCPNPHSPNAWGALINTAVRRKLLSDTGRYRHMRRVNSHARRSPLYRRTG